MGGGLVRPWLGLLLPPLLLWSRVRGLDTQGCQDNRFFFNLITRKCQLCKKCEGIVEYKERCSKTSDAVCECAPQYRCSENKGQCGKCICNSGEQLTDKGCQSCPDGMFSDQAGGKCQPWTKCPGNKILANGTRTRDVKCHVAPEGTTTASTIQVVISPAVTERDSQLLTISIALTVALLLCVISLLILSIIFRAWAQRKLLAVFVKQPLGQLAQEVDDCSYRYPEEEEGGGEGLKGELLEKYP